MNRENDNIRIRSWRLSARRLTGELREYGHHAVFALLIVSLAVLTGKWAVYITGYIDSTNELRAEVIQLEARLLAARLRAEPGRRLRVGVFPADRRFELVAAEAAPGPAALSLAPAHPGLRLNPRPAELAAVEGKFRLRRLMILGESLAAVLLVLGCSLLLYSYVRAERRAAREVANFWQHLTHEVKTPITGIKFFLQGLRDGTVAGAETADLTALALSQVERQERLAENLLAGSRWLGRPGRPRPEVIDLDEFLTAHLANHPLQLAGAEVEIAGAPGLRVSADRAMLRLILDNLLDNALKYGPRPCRVTLRRETDRGRPALRVEDGGPPFTPGQARRMFAAYKYAAAELPARRRGSGMGLYLSRQLARQMGGDLVAGCRRAACASLRLTLPRP